MSLPWCRKINPTTLFLVAGMARFKDMFLGRGVDILYPFNDLPEMHAYQ